MNQLINRSRRWFCTFPEKPQFTSRAKRNFPRLSVTGQPQLFWTRTFAELFVSLIGPPSKRYYGAINGLGILIVSFRWRGACCQLHFPKWQNRFEKFTDFPITATLLFGPLEKVDTWGMQQWNCWCDRDSTSFFQNSVTLIFIEISKGNRDKMIWPTWNQEEVCLSLESVPQN
jgi:hypothetical protein